MKKVLLTGAAGFIGSHVARKLVRKGYEVIAPVKSTSDLWRIKDIKSKLVLSRIDLTDFAQVARLLKKHKPNYIVHCATRGVYPQQWSNRKEIIDGNYLMNVNLLEACSQMADKLKLKRFINTGSVFEYGSRPGKMKEDRVNFVDNLNLYSASKKATTILSHSPPYIDQFPIVTLRPFTAYGPYGARSRFIEATILRCLNGEDVRIVPGVIRDFVYVEDVADAYVKTLTSKKCVDEILNVGSGEAHSLEETSEMVRNLTKAKVKIVVDKSYKRSRDSRCWADLSKAKKLLNWKPQNSLRTNMLNTIDWYRVNSAIVPQ
jgi:nucleoside-diphosphate-sugar epimerase